MRLKRSRILLLVLASLLSGAFSHAAKTGVSATALSAEALSAKALLEELIVKRYGSELATLIPKDFFTMGSTLDLTYIDPNKRPAPQEEQPLNDLMLGTLDPEALMKKFSDGDARDVVKGVLNNYRIKTVKISVGLKEEKTTERKAQVEKWLSDRIASEFGKNGSGVVNVVTYPEVKPEPKGFWDLLTQLQSLAGQIILALALLLGTVLWKVMSGGKSASDAMSVNMNGQLAGASGGADSAKQSELAVSLENKKKENETYAKEIDALSSRLVALMPKLSKDFENVVRSWCQQGEQGQFKLVCFAEAVGREIGRLPIPVDAVSNVTKIFARMNETGLKEKKAALEKAYWDLLSVLNLGAEALAQPFSYLGGVNVDTVNQVLMDQNPKMRTLVSLFIPSDLRDRYMRGLDIDKKREILESAAQLSTIPATELKSMDTSLSAKLNRKGSGEDLVPLDMSIQKIVGSLTRVEEITLLAGMSGYAIQAYKRVTASLAFLHEWPDDLLSLLVSRSTVDELVALSRIRQDMKDRLLGLCPPMTATMATDELNREDKFSESDKNVLLQNLRERLESMVENKEVDLERIFPAPTREDAAPLRSVA